MNLVNQINVSNKRSNKKIILIVVAIFMLSIAAAILPFFINPKAFYDFKDGKVYFGSRELPHIKANDFRPLDYSVAVDCTKVYYNGNPVEFVDRKTFKNLNKGFYFDKKGLYYEKTSLYSKNKLLPLKGNYDQATFHSLGYQTTLFADKTNLYTIDVFGDPPLEKVEVPGLDIATIESLHNNWLRDKSRIYFDDWGKIKACPEIDAATFVVLNYTVAKDKNKVYYITRGLKSDQKEATQKADYAVLDGADAGSFEMVNNKEYRDKNQTWTISREGEQINYNVPEGKSKL